MFEPTHDGVRVTLMDPDHARKLARQRVLGGILALFAVGLGLLFWLDGAPTLAAIAFLGLLPLGVGTFALSREKREALLVNQHLVRMESGGAVVRSVPLHDVEGVSAYEELLVLHTREGDLELAMPGRHIDDNSDVAVLVEELIDRFRHAHGEADVPDALSRLRGREPEP